MRQAHLLLIKSPITDRSTSIVTEDMSVVESSWVADFYNQIATF